MEFRGVSLEQDKRFADKNKRIRSQVKVPKEFEVKVDLKKVHLDVLKPWIAKRITALLGFEDEVVISFVISSLEDQRNSEKADPIDMQINLTGFLERNTPTFMTELWKLLISAQNNYSHDPAGKPLLGVPQELLEEKKAEILAAKLQHDRVQEELKKKREAAEQQKQQLTQRDNKGGEDRGREHDRRDRDRGHDRRDRDREYDRRDRDRDYDRRDRDREYDRRDRGREYDRRERDRRDRDYDRGRRDREYDRRDRDRDRDREKDKSRRSRSPVADKDRRPPPPPRRSKHSSSSSSGSSSSSSDSEH